MSSPTIELPFKPFTFDEVARITDARPTLLDAWANGPLMPRLGDDRVTVGFDYHQTFGIFCGVKWLKEGAGVGRSTAVARFMSSVSMDHLENEMRAGRLFPAPAEMTKGGRGVFIAPPTTRLGQRLRLDRMLAEFKAAVARVFPAEQRIVIPTS